jgi:hypothetical protein
MIETTYHCGEASAARAETEQTQLGNELAAAAAFFAHSALGVATVRGVPAKMAPARCLSVCTAWPFV